jgi:hypothetical protein
MIFCEKHYYFDVLKSCSYIVITCLVYIVVATTIALHATNHNKLGSTGQE